jgi:hypothetical protein
VKIEPAAPTPIPQPIMPGVFGEMLPTYTGPTNRIKNFISGR